VAFLHRSLTCLADACFIVRDADGRALAYVDFDLAVTRARVCNANQGNVGAEGSIAAEGKCSSVGGPPP
jgi:hypothetical protein